MLTALTRRNALCIIPFAAAALLITTAGCSQFESGGGSRSVTSGNARGKAVFGTGAGRKLGFVIFNNLPSEGTVTSTSSKWNGKIAPTQGPAVEYSRENDGMSINGTNYSFDNGRVFLTSNEAGTIVVKQLNLPLGEGKYDAEIDRLANTEEVKQFFAEESTDE